MLVSGSGTFAADKRMRSALIRPGLLSSRKRMRMYAVQMFSQARSRLWTKRM